MILYLTIGVSALVIFAACYVACRLLKNVPDARGLKRILFYVYLSVGSWSLVYFLGCVAYGGFSLSWIWIWLIIGAFCMARCYLLLSEMKHTWKFHVPKWLRIAYRIVFGVCLIFFIVVEGRIINAMTALPKNDLDYVVVLGAGVRGTTPTNPLRARIRKAAEYMQENPDTILIASGGQGRGEDISEALCIKENLVESYGISPERILLEEASYDTETNLIYSMEIIQDADASVGIISNGFHEYRACMIAEHVGYENVHSVPAATLLPLGIHFVVREFFGVVECMMRYGTF